MAEEVVAEEGVVVVIVAAPSVTSPATLASSAKGYLTDKRLKTRDGGVTIDEGADQTLGCDDRSTSYHHRSEHHSTVPLHQPGLRSSDTGNRVSR